MLTKWCAVKNKEIALNLIILLGGGEGQMNDVQQDKQVPQDF